MRFLKFIRCFVLLALILGGCSEKEKALRVGVTAGPHAIIMEEVKRLAIAEGLLIQIVEFNDFNLPNAALAQGDLDINIYQHRPFLEEQILNRGYDLKIIGNAVIMPLGLYSKKLKNFSSINSHFIKPAEKIAIPNDPTNEGRALKLLESANLIKLKPSPNPTPLDIIDNPLSFEFVEVEAPQLARVLEDVSLAVINTDWVVLSGMDPRTALFKEDAPQEFINVIVVKNGDQTRSEIARFLKIYQSETVRKFIDEKFLGTVQAAW
ncbi:MetQ/NlpA family ABC transporter substrate-binding protein [Candidatus Nucleicultrix amoebiphila]|jgi:D-methionine transport system substrate-binding protein|uniref:Lipoprotein n=1 Tax=Candidatus Nucleicultrix amoebiphila FS5 TaxID=1414854 RepID=A0A1W6N430_9PROT|nr:MetQ/NlpA family ABC transporter substrate-binding protein [Candidatus Nucleicultrix amoebiphila]ARN84615.1 hypothetical protein GQ61_04000 [Candidatus Nucleicultrix amoebiphila FS5]